MTVELTGEVLIEGEANGTALVLDEPLSFWGGFDPMTGKIIDVHHPQYGQPVTKRILFIPQSRGSAGTPGGIAETLRNGSGPLAFVLGEPDVNIGVGVLVANQLYAMRVPVLQIPLATMQGIRTGDTVTVARNGALSVG